MSYLRRKYIPKSDTDSNESNNDEIDDLINEIMNENSKIKSIYIYNRNHSILKNLFFFKKIYITNSLT